MQNDGRDGSPPSGSESVAELVSAARAEELRLLDDAVRSLPPDAVKELLSLGVCAQCILRLFGIYGPCYSQSADVLALFPIVNHSHSNEVNMKDELCQKTLDNHDELKEADVCCICHGILQFIYVDDKGVFTRYNCAYSLATSLGEQIKREGYTTESFTLEVSIPQIVVDNENQVRSYMKMKYSSENWFQENLKTQTVAAKDTLKSIFTIPLEEMLGGKSGSSPFRVRLTYSSAGGPGDGKSSSEKDYVCKKRKSDSDASRVNSCRLAEGGTGQVDNIIDEAGLVMAKCQNSSHEPELFKSKMSAFCFTFSCQRMPVYVGGRYLKVVSGATEQYIDKCFSWIFNHQDHCLSRNVSQTRWIIDDERMGEASVEEIIGTCVLPICAGDSYKFHAAGREDIDVRMLGSGRPFLIEIQNARVVPNAELLKEVERKINRPDQEMVRVRNLMVVDSQGWALMREGESEKQKQYAALVWTSRELDDKDFVAICAFQDLKVMQRTPVRVLHRRSPLDREKIIHWMKTEKIAGKSQYFLLHLCTQAGTYIKEFVHGDLGRTNPSIGSILGCRAEILQLDVTDVKMDSFSD